MNIQFKISLIDDARMKVESKMNDYDDDDDDGGGGDGGDGDDQVASSNDEPESLSFVSI